MVLGSGIRDPEKTYSRSRGQKAPDPGSGSLVYHQSFELEIHRHVGIFDPSL